MSAAFAVFFCECKEIVEDLLRELIVFDQIALDIGDDEFVVLSSAASWRRTAYEAPSSGSSRMPTTSNEPMRRRSSRC